MNKYLASILKNVNLLDDYSSFRVLIMLIDKYGIPNLENRMGYVPVPRWVEKNPYISVELRKTLSRYPHLCIKDVVYLYPEVKSLKVEVITELREKLGMESQVKYN